MLNFKNSKKSYLLFTGFFLLLSQGLFSMEEPFGSGRRSRGGFFLPAEDEFEKRNAFADLQKAIKKLTSNPNDPDSLAEVHAAQSKYNDLTGRSFKSGFWAPFKNKFPNINSITAFFGMIICSCTLYPFVEKVSEEMKNQLNGSMSNWFYYLFGGLGSKVAREVAHCKELFDSLTREIALVTRLSSREVSSGMNTRIRLPNDPTNPDNKDAQKPSEIAAQETYKCPICQKSDGPMEFFFDCNGKTDHGMHPECAIQLFASSKDKNCPICKAERKFDVMSKDPAISSHLVKLNIKSALQSHILIFNAAQKKINVLIKQINKVHDKNKYLTERTMLYGILMDIRNLTDILGNVICQNDFYNQETLKKLDIAAAIGSYNCQTLITYIQNSARKEGIGLRRDGIGSGYSGAGLGGGFGSGLGGSGF